MFRDLIDALVVYMARSEAVHEARDEFGMDGRPSPRLAARAAACRAAGERLYAIADALDARSSPDQTITDPSLIEGEPDDGSR